VPITGTDLRALTLAAAAWCGALAALLLPGRLAGTLVLGVVGVTVVAVVRRSVAVGWLAPAAALAAVAGVASLQLASVSHSPVSDLAAQRAVVTLDLRVTSDARVVAGQFDDVLVVRGRAVAVDGRGNAWHLDVPVVVLADGQWPAPPLGATIRTRARLAPADGDVAALVSPMGSDPYVLSAPGPLWDAAAAVRRSIRESVADRNPDQAALVPALVDGDDVDIDPDLADDFRDTGLTHLLAVSGTNLTLVVGFLLIVGRWLGVRGRGTYVLASIGIVGFVLVARTEPSVVRAAAMGTVALIGMGTNGLSRGTRCLGVAALVLLLFSPRLAVTAGFALSVLATAGILILAPIWRDALDQWLPRWVSEAIAVPLAAQVACTPVVAGISGDVSLVAVGANLVAAPAVAPATVLGLGGGLAGLLWAPLGALIAAPGAWSAGWIIGVARRCADLPTPAVEWGSGPIALTLLTALCLVMVAAAPRVLAQPVAAVGCCVLLVVTVFIRLPAPGWPPEGWVIAMCDVGQGDALVLNAGSGAGVVVDVGQEPEAVDGCLHRLGVTRVPLVVVTHFHADHAGGLSGVLDGREVGAVETTPLALPPDGASAVATQWGRPPAVAPYAQTRRVGDVTLQPVWPLPGTLEGSSDESAVNDASVVLVAEVGGVRILLTGDLEPPGQAALRRSLADLEVDVLKVPHHGSRHQDLDWLTSLGADIALVSVGEDNDYGHPAHDVLAALEGSGAGVWRTDESGDVVVVANAGGLGVATRD
jgi:competence protein ComEC